MKHLPLDDALRMFNKLFSAARHDMFKLEVLQDYSIVDDSPSLTAWLAGDMQKARELGRQSEDIIAYRKKCLASPAAITRVHAVKEPYTAYLDWEIEVCYKDSLLAYNAESISLVNHDAITDTDIPAGDFWIFDNEHVLQWEYQNGSGKLMGGYLWDTSAGDSIAYFQKLRDKLLNMATPL